MESGAGGGKPKGGGGGKHVPRHQQMRPSRLSMNLIQTPSANPPPVPVKVVDDATFTAAAAAPSSTTGAPSPVGTSHVAVERLPATAAGKGKRGGKDNKGHRAGVRHSKQPHDARFPSSSSPSNRRHTLPAASSPSSSGTLVRVSSPLCTEVGVASVRSPKAAAAAAAVLSGVRGSKLVSTDNDGARGRGPSSELEELSLDYSGEKEEEDECIQAEAAEEAAAATTKPVAAAGGGAAGCAVGGGIFRPLSPLVLPVLRSPRMRSVLGAENVERLAQALTGDDTQPCPPPSSTNGGSSSSGNGVVETLTSIAKRAAIAATTGATAASPSPASSPQPPLVVAPTPLRLGGNSPPTTTTTVAASACTSPMVGPSTASSFTQVKPHGHHHHHQGKQLVPAPAASKMLRVGSGGGDKGKAEEQEAEGGFVGAVASVPFVVGACLLACGLSQAGIEWYTVTLGSDFGTWWAGGICALLGLTTMACWRSSSSSSAAAADSRPQQQHHRNRAGRALYALLATGAATAIILALFLDLRLLDGLNKADKCGAATDNLVLDNGIVLTQTMGAACGVRSGCACVEYSEPTPGVGGKEVSCLNFPRASVQSCSSIPYGLTGLIRVSIWCIAGLLFFMAVLLLRAGGVPPQQREREQGRGGRSKVRSLSRVRELRGVGSIAETRAEQQQQQWRRRRNTWHSNAAVASVHGEEDGGEEDENEEAEEDVEEAIAVQQQQQQQQQEKAAALASAALHRSALLLTPIPEYTPAYRQPATSAVGEEDQEEEEEEEGDEGLPAQQQAGSVVQT